MAGGAFAYLSLRQPDMAPASTRQVDRSPERIARGKYLFEKVSNCAHCHSVQDETLFGMPPKPGTIGGGAEFPKAMEFPGRVVASNLTSDPETGAGRWSDGQLIRAIREGIGHDDRALFPMMPYSEFKAMSDPDVESVVAYIRTLAPIRNSLPRTEIDFPVNLLMKSAPQPLAAPVPHPDRSNPVAYGGYLVRISGCEFCHTPVDDHHAPIVDKKFAGGQVFFTGPGIRAVSANITPDPDTGIGTLDEAQFLDKFDQYREYIEKGSKAVPAANNTQMPWLSFAGMERDDLKAIYAFLRTVKPVKNDVVTHPDAPESKLPAGAKP